MRLDSFSPTINHAVPSTALQWHRCLDAQCASFRKLVAAPHQHWYQCTNPTCVCFQRYVSAAHQHAAR